MEMGILRQKCDKQDVLSVYEYFKDKSPFDDDGQLRNISNGVVAVSEVNVDIAREVCQKILKLKDWSHIKNLFV